MYSRHQFRLLEVVSDPATNKSTITWNRDLSAKHKQLYKTTVPHFSKETISIHILEGIRSRTVKETNNIENNKK